MALLKCKFCILKSPNYSSRYLDKQYFVLVSMAARQDDETDDNKRGLSRLMSFPEAHT